MYYATNFIFNPSKLIKVQEDNFESLILLFFSFEPSDLCMFKSSFVPSVLVSAIADCCNCFSPHTDISSMT